SGGGLRHRDPDLSGGCLRGEGHGRRRRPARRGQYLHPRTALWRGAAEGVVGDPRLDGDFGRDGGGRHRLAESVLMIWVDADACPVKAEVERVATRRQVKVAMV